MRTTKLYIFLLTAMLVVVLGGCRNSGNQQAEPVDDRKAKAVLQGIWIDADEENVIFKIKGDTIFYPDSTTQPVKFMVVGDTMVLLGNNASRYPIMHIGAHLFEFKNQNNDIVKLVKSDDPNDSLQFVRHRSLVLNQGKVIKNDTVVTFDDKRYHCYVQVNPTTYKVYRSFYNAEGMEIENIYYDNIIHISIYAGASRLFSKDFKKSDFSKAVPGNMLKQCVLSDIELMSVGSNGFKYQTQLAIPDSPSSFIVELLISYDGDFEVSVLN